MRMAHRCPGFRDGQMDSAVMRPMIRPTLAQWAKVRTDPRSSRISFYSSLRCRGPLPAQDEFAHGRQGVTNGPANLDEARAGAVESRLGEPGNGDAQQLGDLGGCSRGSISLFFAGALMGPPPFVSSGWMHDAGVVSAKGVLVTAKLPTRNYVDVPLPLVQQTKRETSGHHRGCPAGPRHVSCGFNPGSPWRHVPTSFGRIDGPAYGRLRRRR